jgi:hypothetical protein
MLYKNSEGGVSKPHPISYKNKKKIEISDIFSERK